MPKNDYLKYWKVIRYFAKAKYKLNTSDLDMLFFLYSEKYFGKQQFNEFDELIEKKFRIRWAAAGLRVEL